MIEVGVQFLDRGRRRWKDFENLVRDEDGTRVMVGEGEGEMSGESGEKLVFFIKIKTKLQ